MSTYTSSLGLEEITPGDQAGLWGNTTNNNLALIDQAVTGVTPISFTGLSGTVYTLTDFDGAVDEARSAVLNITGIATGSNTVVVPNKQKTYLVRNNTGQNVVFRTASPTATYTVEAGNSILIFCDGNNNVFTGIASPSIGTLGVAGGGTGATTFTAGFVKSTGGTNSLTSSSAVNLASEVTGTLPVPSGGTGQTSFTSGALLRGNGSGAVATLVGSANGQVATWNGSEWTAQTPATGAVTSVFGRSGAVSAQSSDYSSFYYPLSSNPAGYVTNSALSAYAPLSGATFTGDVIRSSGGFSGLQSNAVVLGNSSTGIFNTGSSNFGFQSGGTVVLFIAPGTGTVTNLSGLYQQISDERIKENVQPARSYFSDLQKLNVVNYNIKGQAEKYLGFVAQEVQEVIPGLVEANAANEAFPDVPNLLSVKTSVLIPMLVQAVQELKAELDEAKAEIAALKAK